MNKEKRSLFVRFLIGFVILVGLDQWTKGLASAYLKGNSPLVLIRGVFELYYSENRGAAFGMLQEKQLFFFLIAVLVLAGVLYMLWRMLMENITVLLLYADAYCFRRCWKYDRPHYPELRSGFPVFFPDQLPDL